MCRNHVYQDFHARSEEAMSLRDAAVRYTTMGWTIIPIPAGMKAPAHAEWNKKGVSDPEAATEIWTRMPNANIGLLHRPSHTATLDADGTKEEVAEALARAGIDYYGLLEEYPVQIIGNPAKPPKLLFRLPEGLERLGRRVLAVGEGERRHVVFELRAGLVQDVLPPSIHPDTGQPYRWSGDEPEEIPEIPVDLYLLWTEWAQWVPALRGERRGKAKKRIKPARRAMLGTPNTIARWNAEYTVEDMLDRYGYEDHGDRWRRPGGTGPAGVIVNGSRAYSYHNGDPLLNDHAHDAFSIYCTLEWNGNLRIAMKAAEQELDSLTDPNHTNRRI